MIDLLPGFTSVPTDVEGLTVHAVTAGEGPPVLLLHGYPQTHVMWHRVAPALAASRTVVLADLRGYGDSAKPADAGYDKRAMADDLVGLMRALGHERFAVVGHDRGGRVAHRLALDHPQSVSALAVLDIVATLHMFEHVDLSMATSYFHWFFLTQGSGLPERLIGADPQAWLDSRFAGRHAGGRGLDAMALAEYARCFDLDTIAASCADYRAAAGVDLEHDRADRAAGRVITAPTLALWGTASYVGRNFDVLASWAPFAPGTQGHGIHADHYLAEEAPEDVLAALRPFLAAAQ